MKKYKRNDNWSYAIGVYPSIELFKYRSDKVRQVFFDKKAVKNKGFGEIKDLCKKNNINITENSKLVEQLSESKNAYVVTMFDKYKTKLEDNQDHLVLVDPRDAGNMGTIIRTMLAFGFNNLAIIKPGVDIFLPKVIRASMGSIFQINFQYFNNIDEYQDKFKNNLYPFMTQADKYIDEVEYKKPFGLVFGNESSGLDIGYLKLGKSVKIWQGDKVDSLNLAVAVAIGLYTCKNR